MLAIMGFRINWYIGQSYQFEGAINCRCAFDYLFFLIQETRLHTKHINMLYIVTKGNKGMNRMCL